MAAIVARCTAEQVRDLVLQVGTIVDQFADADPADRAGLYQQLGIDLLYKPAERLVVASADLGWHIEGVGGATPTICIPTPHDHASPLSSGDSGDLLVMVRWTTM